MVPGTRFSKVPKLFGHISGDIILFVSSKRRRLEAGNFAFILIFIPFTQYEKNGFTELAGRNFTNGFSGPKSFRDVREKGPRSLLSFLQLSPGSKKRLGRVTTYFHMPKFEARILFAAILVRPPYVPQLWICGLKMKLKYTNRQ